MKRVGFFIILAVIVVSSCKESKEYDVDVSDIDVNMQVKHFEKDLFKFNLDSSEYYIDHYKQTYGEFFKLYCMQIVELGDPDEKYFPMNLNEFMRFWEPKKIDSIISAEFPDFEKEQLPKLEEAFKYYHYYFPDRHIPGIITYFSSFGYSVVSLDSVTGIGLDKYLGVNNFDIYDKVGYPLYQKRRMVKEMMPVDVMRSTAESEFVYEPESTDNFLDHMIYEGKIQYFLNCMLPQTPDTLKWMYTEKQLDWAVRYERKVWDYIAQQKLLYSTDYSEIRKFTGDGPYTTIFTDVSAPRAGVFVGFKIVEHYMKNNPDKTLIELMDDKNSKEILSGAKYNP